MAKALSRRPTSLTFKSLPPSYCSWEHGVKGLLLLAATKKSLAAEGEE